MKNIVKSLLLGATALAFIGVVTTTSTAGGDGKVIFTASKCSSCHSIESQGIKRTVDPKPGEVVPSDLSGAGLKHDAAWFEKWLMKEVELEGKTHIKKFKGSDDDLKTLCAWLGTLKTKPKGK
jgi:mono/diheme cytochrome c family protein